MKQIKTPEQLAEEYANESGWLEGDYVWREAEGGFLAGYQAAKELYAAKLKEANDTVAGMADECEGLKTIIYDHDETILPTPAKWISVKDRLPEESTHCVIRIDDGEYQVAWREDGHWIMFNPCCIYNSQLNNVTHWQPLPAPPKEEK